MENNKEYSIVTEVGVFGDLNIEDPTAKTVKKKNDESSIDDLIADSIKANANLMNG